MKTLIAQARWRRSQIAETFASVRVSASCYRLAEYIRFLAVVKSELKLVQIQRQIFFAHVMVGTDHATFQETPKTLDALGVNVAAHVLTSGMPNKLMLTVVNADRIVAAPFVRDYQCRVSLGNFADESGQGFRVRAFNHLADDIALARDCADYGHLASMRRASAAVLLAILPMAINVLSADECFIHFHDSHQLPELRVFHSSAETHAHIPRGLIRAGSEHPMDLECTDSLLRRDHQVQNLEPHEQRLLRFLENGSGSQREAIGRAGFRAALHTLPMPRSRHALVHVIIVAAWTTRASGPASQEQICTACFLIGKQRVELAERQLSHEARLVFVLCLCHDSKISKNESVSQEPDNPPKSVSRETFVSGS